MSQSQRYILAFVASVVFSGVVSTSLAQEHQSGHFDTSSNTYFWLRHYEGHQLGDVDAYTSAGGVKYIEVGDGVLLFEAQGLVQNDGGAGGTFGVNRRILLGDTVFGAGLWYDFNESKYDQVYQQGSFTLEMLRDDISVRVHGFVPIGPQDRVVGNNVVATSSIVSYSGNDLVLDLLAVGLTDREVAMKGIDVDIAHSISDFSAEAFVGYYNFQGRYGGQSHGVKGGVRGYMTENLAASATVSNDKFFGTNVFGGFTWFFGGGRVMPRTIEDKLYIPTERNTQVPIRRVQESIVTTASVVLTQNGNPINITHVGGENSGSGAFESPLGNLVDANGTDSEIILVYANTQFFGQSIQLQPGQRLLGEADGITHFVDTDQLGTIPLPRVTSGTAPLIGGSAITPAGGLGLDPQSNPTEVTGIEFVPTITGTELQAGLTNPADLSGQGTQPTTWQIQRSDLRTIEVEFSETIQLTADDIRLINLGVDADNETDIVIDMSNATITVTGNVVRIQFDDALPDGVYQLDILPTATDVAGNPIDGNGDGFPGDGFSLVGNSNNRLFQLTGDFNGDAIVDNEDVTTFQYWFRSTTEDQGGGAPSYVDLDSDGGIGIGDWFQIFNNTNNAVVFPTSP
ncbi:MAG: hypothetical protein ACI9HK_005188 [Pirellulaceae bacterium]|jgi:hypothetical protein